MTDMTTAAKHIVEKLVFHGHTAYFAGGCVRDMLLGLPAKDIDIATSASCSDIEQLFPNTIGVGRQFGIMVVIHEKHQFELAQFRNDIYNYSCKNFEPRE